MKPFNVRNVTDTNSADWIEDIQAAPAWMQILWPAEEGYSSGGQLLIKGGLTSVDYGFADIESRVEGSFIYTPTRKPIILPGVVIT